MTGRRSRSLAVPALLGLLLPVAAAAASAVPAGVSEPLDPKTFDAAVAPCADLYRFVNGPWMGKNPVPADQPYWGAFDELHERNLAVVHQILDDASADKGSPAGSLKRKVGDFYRMGMDAERIEKDGAKPLAPILQKIDAVKDVGGLADEIALLASYGVPCTWGSAECRLAPVVSYSVQQDLRDSSRQISWLYQSGLGLPDRDYYTKPDEKEMRAKYEAHMTKMLTLLGESAEQAAQDTQTVMAIETRLAKASMTRIELRDPQALEHKMSLNQLQGLAPGFPWARFFKAAGAPEPGEINVGQPEFVKEVAKMASEVPIASWRAYLRWQILNATASRLSSPFVNEDFAFSGAVVNGAKELKPRWKRQLSETDRALGEALGQLYVEKAFGPDAKARALDLVKNMKAALRERLLAIDWISDETRRLAIEKLDAIAIKIGYPDHWRDYTTLKVDAGSHLGNVLQAGNFEYRRNLAKLGKPVDRGEWGMTPPTVNAYYNPYNNEIVFPAGILQPPFFDNQADDAINYGGIGSVIGHELTHGFDDQGRQFDAVGNLKNWWTPTDEKNFGDRASLIEKKYDGYVVIDKVAINGKLTLGENIADLGGLKIAYVAYQKAVAGKPQTAIDGYTPDQRFFLSFARIWRENVRPESQRLLLATDPHSPGRFRVLGSTSNTPEFAKAFSCPASEGDAASQARIW